MYYGTIECNILPLNIVDIQLAVVLRLLVVVTELEVDLFVVVGTESIGFINLSGFWQLTDVLQGSCLIRIVFVDDVTLVSLKISQRHQYDITLTHPHLLSQFSSDVAHSLFAIKTAHFDSTITQHLRDLGVLLALILVDQFSFLTTVVILSFSSILSSLSFGRFTHYELVGSTLDGPQSLREKKKFCMKVRGARVCGQVSAH